MALTYLPITCEQCKKKFMGSVSRTKCDDCKQYKRPLLVNRSTPWGNPYRVGMLCLRCFRIHEAPGSTLQCFEEYARERLQEEPQWLDRLVGRQLNCTGCPPNSPTCHARILERLRPQVKP